MRLLTLGGLELRADNGTPLRAQATQQKRVALLCYIALRDPGTYVQRSSILSVLWPESDESRARNALRNTLHHLRSQIGADALLSRGDEELAINPAVLWCDAVAFEQAYAAGRYEEALQLYRGPLLEGFLIADAPDFTEWLDTRRRTLAWHAADAAKQLAERASEENPREAVGWARRWVELSPYEERAIRALMHVLAQAGERADAIAAFEVWQSRLARELNATPSADTLRVAEALRKKSVLQRLVPRSEPAVEPAVARPKRQRLIAAMALAVGVLVFGGMMTLLRDATPDGTATVAVMPFSYGGSAQYGFLREGMVDLLATRLASTGVRAADPRSVIALADRGGRAELVDPRRGRALARDVGAAYYVLGSVLEVNGTVRISASLYDAAGRRSPLADTTVSGNVGQVFALAEQLSGALSRTRALRSHPGSGDAQPGTTSIAAIHAFVEGERAYNAARFDDAAAAYGRAIKADPDFARAYLRFSIAAHWTANNYDIEYGLEQALKRQNRLTTDDRMLLQAWDAHVHGRPREADSLYNEYTELHPENADGWLQLGEVRYHWGSTLRRSPAQAREAFVKAASLSSHEAPAITHLLRIAGRENDSVEVKRLASNLLRLKPRDLESFEARMIAALTGRDSAAARAIAREPAGANAAGRLFFMSVIGASVPDPSAISSIVPLLLTERVDLRQREFYFVIQAQAAAAGGRFRNAEVHLDSLARVNPARAYELRCMFALLPLRNVSRERLVALRAGLRDYSAVAADSFMSTHTIYRPIRLLLQGLLDVRLGDYAQAEHNASELSRLEGPGPLPKIMGRRGARVVRAEMHLAQGRWVDASRVVNEPDIVPNSGYPDLYNWSEAFDRFALAESLFRMKSDRRASHFEVFPDATGFDIEFVAQAHLRLAQTYDEMQDRAAARRHYKLVAEIWRNADGELAPHLAFVRERLNALR